jgi:hypothetical protein
MPVVIFMPISSNTAQKAKASLFTKSTPSANQNLKL